MDGARLAGSDASDALFDYVVLRGADMRQALFQNANFIRSDVEETDIDGADFTEAVLDRYQLRGLCEHATGTNEVTMRRTFDSLQCSEVMNRAYKVRRARVDESATPAHAAPGHEASVRLPDDGGDRLCPR